MAFQRIPREGVSIARSELDELDAHVELPRGLLLGPHDPALGLHHPARDRDQKLDQGAPVDRRLADEHAAPETDYAGLGQLLFAAGLQLLKQHDVLRGHSRKAPPTLGLLLHTPPPAGGQPRFVAPPLSGYQTPVGSRLTFPN